MALGAAAAGVFGTSAGRAGAAEPAWRRRADLPWRVQEIYPCAWRGGILVAGGLRGLSRDFAGEARAAFYDPMTDAWTETAPLPEQRHHAMMLQLGDAALVIGGFTPRAEGFWFNDPAVYSYRPEEGAEPSAPLPRPQAEAVGAVLDGRAHLVTGRTAAGTGNGGFGNQSDIAAHVVYDPAAGAWEEARPAPTARNSAAGAVLDGALHVVGGRTMAGGNLAVHERYDPQSDRWDTLAPMPQGQGGLAAAAMEGRIYAFGGEYSFAASAGVYAECWVYDPQTDLWSPGPDMATPRHGLGGVGLDGRIYAVGGARGPSGQATSAVLEVLAPA